MKWHEVLVHYKVAKDGQYSPFWMGVVHGAARGDSPYTAVHETVADVLGLPLHHLDTYLITYSLMSCMVSGAKDDPEFEKRIAASNTAWNEAYAGMMPSEKAIEEATS